MLRLTVCFAVLAATFASTTEVEAQRRAPLRNLFKNVGLGWGTGNHFQTPGYDSSYYNPYAGTQYSSQNNWQYQSQGQYMMDGQIINDGQIITQPPADGQIYQNAIPDQTTPGQQPTPEQNNSASRLLQQQPRTFQTSQPGQMMQTPTPQTGIQHPGTSSTISDQTQMQINQNINQHLRPYHATTGNNPIHVNHGGQFQIAPSQTPMTNTGWTGQQQIVPSGQYTPRK